MVFSGFSTEFFPIVVAHRGASATSPENTLPAFEAAVGAGAGAVEADVRLTADGIPVILHDAEVSRVSRGRGQVGELTLAEVRRLRVSGPGGQAAPIPTLGEVLAFASGRCAMDLELKNHPHEPSFDPDEVIARVVVEELEASGFKGPVLVSSFNPATLARVRNLAPGLPTGFLTVAAVGPFEALSFAREAGHEWMLPEVTALESAGADAVTAAHGAGVRVGTWTVDDPDALERLFRWGVDAVATNRPDAAVAARDRVLS